jgi:hypothetical protein
MDDPPPLQIEFFLLLDFQCRQASKMFKTLVTCPDGSLGPIFHQDSSRLPATRLGKWKDASDTAAAAAVTALAPLQQATEGDLEGWLQSG